MRGGEPIIRRAVDLMMRLLGEQFVAGETIGQAITHARTQEAKGFRYSYDMLGEAAMTATAATQYLASYEEAINAIGRAAAGRGVIEGPGISVKLSALHPRYSRAKRLRVMTELLPRLKHLARRAKQFDIGLNIDAEEADRLDISLDLLESLATDPDLAGWNGLGFVVQAYGKRAPFVIDWLVDLGQRSDRRLMVRLVKELTGTPRSSARKRTAWTASHIVHAQGLYRCLFSGLCPQDAGVATADLSSFATLCPNIVRSHGNGGCGFSSRTVRVPVPARHG